MPYSHRTGPFLAIIALLFACTIPLHAEPTSAPAAENPRATQIMAQPFEEKHQSVLALRPQRPEDMDVAMVILTTEKDSYIRYCAYCRLIDSPRRVEAYVIGATDPKLQRDVTRNRPMLSMGAHWDPAVLESLRVTMDDPDPNRRVEAAALLGMELGRLTPTAASRRQDPMPPEMPALAQKAAGILVAAAKAPKGQYPQTVLADVHAALAGVQPQLATATTTPLEKDPSPAVRLAGVSSIRTDEAGIAKLRAMFADPDHAVALAAAQRFRYTPGGSKGLMDALNDPNASVRGIAVEMVPGLFPFNEDTRLFEILRMVDAFTPLLKHSDPAVRNLAQVMLLDSRIEDLLPTIYGMDHDADPRVRETALVAAAQVARWNPDLFDRILLATSDSNPSVRHQAISQLGSLLIRFLTPPQRERALTILLQTMQDPDAQLRRTALGNLNDTFGCYTAPGQWERIEQAALTMQQSDPDPRNQNEAKWGRVGRSRAATRPTTLATTRPATSIPAKALTRRVDHEQREVSAILADLKSPDVKLRRQAIDDLPGFELPWEQIVSLLTDLLTDADQSIAESALYRLRYEGGIGACRFLRKPPPGNNEHLDNADPKSRIAALQQLAPYGAAVKPWADGFFRMLRTEKDPDVRSALIAAIVQAYSGKYDPPADSVPADWDR